MDFYFDGTVCPRSDSSVIKYLAVHMKRLRLSGSTHRMTAYGGLFPVPRLDAYVLCVRGAHY